MHWIRRSAFLLCTALLAFGGIFYAGHSASAQQRMLVVGDSQGDGLVGPLRPLLEAADFTIVGDETWSGWRTSYFLTGREGGSGVASRPGGEGPGILEDVVGRTNPDIVLFILGGNDFPNAALRSDIREVVRIARTSAEHIVWVGPASTAEEGSIEPTVHERHTRVAGIQREILAALWIDGMPGSQSGPYQSDGVHLTRDGYERWAGELAPQIIALAGGDASTAPTSTGGTAGGSDLGAIAAPCPEASSVFPIQLGVRIGALGSVNGIAEYINAAYRYLVSVILVVAIVMVVYGGFRYLVGAGVGGVQRGKEIIRDAIVGMLIVLGAYVILVTLNPATTNLSGIQPKTVGCEDFNLEAAQGLNSCEQDSDCSEGQHCVETRWVFESNPEDAGYEGAKVGAVIGSPALLPGAVAGGAIGYTVGVFSNLGRTIKACTDGTVGSACGENEHCTEPGTICSESWNVCIRSSGNPPGSPCDEDEQCTASEGEAECVGGDQKVCRGSATILTYEDLRTAGFDLDNLPQSKICFGNHDCREPGARCSGPGGSEVRFCVPGSAWVDGFFGESYRSEEDQVRDGSLCFADSNGAILPGTCNGVGGFTCMVCPPSGTRNWERLSPRTDPDRVRVGSCKPSSAEGTPCASTR